MARNHAVDEGSGCIVAIDGQGHDGLVFCLHKHVPSHAQALRVERCEQRRFCEGEVIYRDCPQQESRIGCCHKLQLFRQICDEDTRSVFHVGVGIEIQCRFKGASQDFSIVANAVGIGIFGAVSATYAENVKLIAVAVTISRRREDAAAVIDACAGIVIARRNIDAPHAIA